MATPQELRAYLNSLHKVDIKDRSQFHEFFALGIDLLELTDDDVARRFDVSRPTVNRWRNSRYAPHPMMRVPVFDWLKQRADKLIRRKEGSAHVVKPPKPEDVAPLPPCLEQFVGDQKVDSCGLAASGAGLAVDFPPFVILNEVLFGGEQLELTFTRDDDGRGWLIGLEGGSVALRHQVRLVVKHTDGSQEVFLGAKIAAGGCWLLLDSHTPVAKLMLVMAEESQR